MIPPNVARRARGAVEGPLMRYQCRACEAIQWRGLFPEPTVDLRYAVIHGVALGVCGIATKLLFARFGQTTDGWRNGLVSLGLCAALMIALYGAAIVSEALWMATRRCRECDQRELYLA